MVGKAVPTYSLKNGTLIVGLGPAYGLKDPMVCPHQLTFDVRGAVLVQSAVPPVVLVIGIIGIVGGSCGPLAMKAFYKPAYENLMQPLQGSQMSGSAGSFRRFAQGTTPPIYRLQQLMFTIAGWLFLAIGVLSLIVYVVGFWGINLFELLLG